jgi:hypothetical protein
MSTDSTAEGYDWAHFRNDWCVEAEERVPFEIHDCLPRALHHLTEDATRLRKAMEFAIHEACAQQRLDTPWLFPTQRYFTRWVTVTTSRCLLGVTLPRRAVLPLLVEIDQPHCAMLTYYRADSFRVASDLCYVFDPMTAHDVLRILNEAHQRWQAFFQL